MYFQRRGRGRFELRATLSRRGGDSEEIARLWNTNFVDGVYVVLTSKFDLDDPIRRLIHSRQF
jgi:hypothetical protein